MRVILFAMLIGGSLSCEKLLVTLAKDHNVPADVHKKCNSLVGAFNTMHAPQYKKVINKAMLLSMKYMAISSHFGRDTNHLMGFKKLFRGASDERFQQAVDMIKYVVKRGGTVKEALDVQMPVAPQYQPSSLSSLGLALADAKDMYSKHESLHRSALCLIPEASGMADAGCSLDADVAHQAQDALGSEVERVNDLASKANLLASMFTRDEHSLAEHIFDQNLLK